MSYMPSCIFSVFFFFYLPYLPTAERHNIRHYIPRHTATAAARRKDPISAILPTQINTVFFIDTHPARPAKHLILERFVFHSAVIPLRDNSPILLLAPANRLLRLFITSEIAPSFIQSVWIYSLGCSKMYYKRSRVTKVLHCHWSHLSKKAYSSKAERSTRSSRLLIFSKTGQQNVDLPPFCHFLNWSIAQVSSAQLYWVMYSPRNCGFPVSR